MIATGRRVNSGLTTLLQRVRLRLDRGPGARFLSHLQQIDVIRRALEKTSWPLSRHGGGERSQSRRARPKIAFGPAISVGYESMAEYCDVELSGRIDLTKAKIELEEMMPEGFKLLSIKSIPRFFPSLDHSLNMAAYTIQAPFLEESRSLWEEFWKKDHVMVLKKKTDQEVWVDARRCVRSWELGPQGLGLYVRFGPGRTLKPERIMQEVCQKSVEEVDASRQDSQVRILKEQMYFEKTDGGLVEP